MRGVARSGLAAIVLLAGLLVGARQVIYVKTQRAIFDPQPPESVLPSQVGLSYEPFSIRSGGRSLAAWWLPSAGADSGAVLVFAGNAENRTDWLSAARLLHEHHLTVMLFDYTGYGSSPGTPSVSAVVEDGVSALREFERRVGPGKRHVAVGLSLGSGILMEAVSRVPRALDGVALLEPFSSGREAAVQERLLPAWAAPLMPDVFDNVKNAGRLKVPLVVVHSRGDKRFPVSFAERIVQAAPGPKRLVVLDAYDHAAARVHPTEEYWAPVVQLAKHP